MHKANSKRMNASFQEGMTASNLRDGMSVPYIQHVYSKRITTKRNERWTTQLSDVLHSFTTAHLQLAQQCKQTHFRTFGCGTQNGPLGL